MTQPVSVRVCVCVSVCTLFFICVFIFIYLLCVVFCICICTYCLVSNKNSNNRAPFSLFCSQTPLTDLRRSDGFGPSAAAAFIHSSGGLEGKHHLA